MGDIFISGTIGYIHLKNDNNHILLLSDNHSSTNYCKIENSQFISKWLLTKKNSKVLLEEVPRKKGSKLLELWPSIQHTQELKDLYLNQKINDKQIEGIDIRPLLVPFNLDIFKIDNIDKEYIEEIKNTYIIDYLKSLDSFFKFKYIENIGIIYINNKKLKKHFFELKKRFIYLKRKKQYDDNVFVINIDEEFKKELDELLSSIMEWYTIAKIFYNNELCINKFIIHAGLFHTTNLNKILIDSYGYEEINSDGVIDFKKIKDDDINEIKDDDINCLKIPSSVNNQFDEYDEKYRKYKVKYLTLKKKYFGAI